MVQEHKDQGTVVLVVQGGIPYIFRRTKPGGSIFYAWFSVMHSRLDIAVRDFPEQSCVEVVSHCREIVRTLEGMGNYFDPESELSRVNSSACSGPVPISHELSDMLGKCREYYERTGGYFDIFIQSEPYVSGLISNMEIRNGSVKFHQKGMRADLSGFLKGYALDRIRPVIEDAGISDALINLGNSSILALGFREKGIPWKIEAAGKVYELSGGQYLTTSGNDSPSRRHIVSPVSGEIITGTGEISVVTTGTDGGAYGEALSTALFAGMPA